MLQNKLHVFAACTLRYGENVRKTHPRDGSLSASNPTTALDTLNFRLTMKEGAGKAKYLWLQTISTAERCIQKFP